jgi:hypothetical protein
MIIAFTGRAEAAKAQRMTSPPNQHKQVGHLGR